MNFKTYPVPKHLKNYVRYFWSCDIGDSQKTILFKNFADRFPRLVFQVDEKPLLMNLENQQTPQAYICGIDTYTSTAKIESNFSHFGVSFHPFALYQIFGLNSQEMVDTILDLKTIGYNQLIDRLNTAQNHEARINAIGSFIENKLNRKTIANTNIQEIILNNEIAFNTDLFALQKHYHITERTLERLFKANLGISPKKYQRMVRFEKSLELLTALPSIEMTAIVYQLHYADQSHFIKDFRRFADTTPQHFQQQKFLFSESAAFISEL